MRRRRRHSRSRRRRRRTPAIILPGSRRTMMTRRRRRRRAPIIMLPGSRRARRRRRGRAVMMPRRTMVRRRRRRSCHGRAGGGKGKSRCSDYRCHQFGESVHFGHPLYSGFIPLLETQLTDFLKTAFSFSSHSQYSQKPPGLNDNFIKDITNCEKSPELCFWKAGKEPLPAPAQLPETGASGENAGSPGFGKQKSGGPRRKKEKEREKIKKRTAPGQEN